MIIIPAIDIFESKIVRLSKGDFDNITYYKNTPLKQAQIYESLGFKILHIVDLIGSKTGKITSLDTLKEIKENTNLQIQFGGGIRDVKTVQQLLGADADYVVIGSLPVKNRNEFELIIEKCKPHNLVVAADVKEEKVFISGWTEETSVSVYDHISYCRNLGVKKFICTDISKDGMMTGTNTDLYKKLLAKFPDIELIASGGVKDIEDVKKLNEINPYAVVVGKAIYENVIDLKELAEFVV